MEYLEFISQIKNNKDIIKKLLCNITEEQARWRPGKDRSTILEIINHLTDIEKDDLRVELDMVLFHPLDTWPQLLNIEQWRFERKYNEQNFNDSILNFISERDKSICILEEYNNRNLKTLHSGNGYFGNPKSVENVLTSWITHDLFHIHQISLLYCSILDEWTKVSYPTYTEVKT